MPWPLVVGPWKLSTLIALPFLLALAPSASAQWPQFRGPSGQGHASETGLPLEWSESRNVLWKTAVAGRGWSSPVVAGNRIWLTTSIDSTEARRRGVSLRALAFDLATGREVVNAEVFQLDRPEPLNSKNSYASPTRSGDGVSGAPRFRVHATCDFVTSPDPSGRTAISVGC